MEKKIKYHPILKKLDGMLISEFLTEFDVYEQVVINKRLGLPDAEICTSLSMKVMSQLVKRKIEIERKDRIFAKAL